MDNLKIYQICHHLITYLATLIFPKKSLLGPIFRTGGSIYQRDGIRTQGAVCFHFNE